MQKNVNKFTKEKINQNTNVRAKTQFCQRIVGNYSSPIHRPHPLLRNLSPASKWIIKKTKIGSFDTMGGAEGKKRGVAGWLGGGRGFKGTTRTRGSEVSASYLKKKISIFLSIFLFISESIQQRAARYGSSIKYFFLSFSSTQCVNLTHFSLFFCLQVHNTETKINRKLCPRRWFYKNLLRAGSFSFPSHLFRPAVEKLVGNALTSRYSRSFPQLYGERKLKKILPRIGFRSTLPYDRMERGAVL